MTYIHPTAIVDTTALLGNDSFVWSNSQIRENVLIGNDCIISKGVYVHTGTVIGNRVKIQNNVSIYDADIDDGVFVGPHVCFTNDNYPRAINPDGSLKKSTDWEVSRIKIEYGASIGANSTLLPGIKLGKFCLIGSGSVVTRDVPPYSLSFGNPCRHVCYVCKCAKKLEQGKFCEICNVGLDFKGIIYNG